MIENLPDHHKDKKEYLLSLKDFIDIPTVCIRCRKYGHHITDCRKEEIRSTNPLKINKRKRKQKDIIIKLIENLPNFHKDKKEYLLSLKDSIDIPTVCIRCRKYGHHITDCRKEEKDKKEKIKMKQDKVDTKLITLQELVTETIMVKQGIKEDNSIDINEQNIIEIINLKEFSKPMTEPPSLEKDNLNNDSNRQNILSLTNTETINKEFLT